MKRWPAYNLGNPQKYYRNQYNYIFTNRRWNESGKDETKDIYSREGTNQD